MKMIQNTIHISDVFIARDNCYHKALLSDTVYCLVNIGASTCSKFAFFPLQLPRCLSSPSQPPPGATLGLVPPGPPRTATCTLVPPPASPQPANLPGGRLALVPDGTTVSLAPHIRLLDIPPAHWAGELPTR